MSAHISVLVRNWTSNRFLLRSGFYSGRGIDLSDLNSKILEQFYQGIKSELGQKEASNFVRFVNKLEDLSASAFIVAFEQFWGKGCKTIDIPQESRDRVRLDAEQGPALTVQAFGTVISAMFGRDDEVNDRWRSESVKSEFVWNHADEIPADELPCNGGMHCDYAG